jgi:hypothetical protein
VASEIRIEAGSAESAAALESQADGFPEASLRERSDRTWELVLRSEQRTAPFVLDALVLVQHWLRANDLAAATFVLDGRRCSIPRDGMGSLG